MPEDSTAHDVVLLPSADEERGRATMARCARIMLSLIEVDLSALGEAPKLYLIEHQAVEGSRRGEQMRAYREQLRRRHRQRKMP
jgi:hypothetical protein